jgi:hypothetical protein
MIKIFLYLGVYWISIVGGWLLVEFCVEQMRKAVNPPNWHVFPGLVFWVGGTERAIATTIVIFAPKLLPAFAGGWVALKFAANWQRKTIEGSDNERIAQQSLIALVASSISMAVATASGFLLHPEAVAMLSN